MTRFDTQEMTSAPQAVREHIYEARRFVVSVAVGVIAGAVVTFALSPGVRDWMVQEDGPIETLTAFTFLLGAVVGGWKWARLASRPAWLLVVPAAAFVGFLDEVSFGARLFGWAPPRVSGIDVDSVHDLFDLTERWAEVGLGLGRSELALIAAAGLAFAVAFLATGGRGHRALGWLRGHPPVAWMTGAIGLGLVAVGLDLVGSNQAMRLAEETAELGAAAMLLVGALAIGAGDPRNE